jgi:hypothetical protein
MTDHKSFADCAAFWKKFPCEAVIDQSNEWRTFSVRLGKRAAA